MAKSSTGNRDVRLTFYVTKEASSALEERRRGRAKIPSVSDLLNEILLGYLGMKPEESAEAAERPKPHLGKRRITKGRVMDFIDERPE